MPALIDLTGKRFGKWLVIGRIHNYERDPMWLCECDCGSRHEVRGGHLRKGTSTGCFACRNHLISHGQAKEGAKSKKYRTWVAIKNRVLNPNQKDYTRYSALGMEHAWHDFDAFNIDVPDPPDDKSTIDRIDTSTGYFRGNVRWVSQREQCRNRQGNVWITYHGEKKLQSDWAKQFNTDPSTLRRRVQRLGVDAAFQLYIESKNVDL